MEPGKRYQFPGFVGVYSCKVKGRFMHPYLWEVMTRDTEGNLVRKYIDPVTPEPKPLNDEADIVQLGGTIEYKNNYIPVALGVSVVVALEVALQLWR